MNFKNKRGFHFLIAVLMLAALFFAGVAAAEDKTCSEYNGRMCVDNCLIIQCDVSTDDGINTAGKVTVVNDYSGLVPGMMLIKTPDGMTVEEAVSYYKNQPGVIFTEPNYISQITIEETVDAGKTPLRATDGSTAPNDPRYPDQWALQNMNVPEAWEYTTGSADVVVAVIDSGVNYNHLDIKDNMWINIGETPNDGIDNDENGYIDDYYGYDFLNKDANPMDNLGHGSHVAGIIGAVGNNGIGISGVAQNVKIMALKIGDNNGVNSGAVIEAIQYATKMGARVMNMSFGSTMYSKALEEAIQAAAEKGILAVTAAGNDVKDTDVQSVYSPCYEVPNIINIAALDENDKLSTYSNYGLATVDVAAPGGDNPGILSLSNTENDGYVYMLGTSMAAPMVSGLAALLLSKNPDLTAVDLKCIIMATVTPDSALTGKVVTGGRVNAGEALKNGDTKYHMITFHSTVKSEGKESLKEIGSQVVKDEECITEPALPINHFKKFDGWYTDKECTSGNRWDFNTPVTNDIDLYAKWIDDESLDIDTSWYYSHESETEYTLSTAAELLGLSKIVYNEPYDPDNPSTYAFSGKVIRLGNNVNLTGINWIPIGVNDNNLFNGTFDGNGHIISSLSVNLPKENYIGLFGICPGKITNLTLNASTITGYDYVGTLGGCGAKLSDVTVTVDTINGHNYVGGIFGLRSNFSSDIDVNISVTIKNGIYAEGTNYDMDGGIGGAFGYGSGNNIKVTILGEIKCSNRDEGGYYVGGAFGSTYEGFHDVSVNVNRIYAKTNVGGIAGYVDGYFEGDVSNCSVVVSDLDAIGCAGTAIGQYILVNQSDSVVPEGSTIKNIFVSGNVNAKGYSGSLSEDKIGGVVGKIITRPISENKLTIENVLVTGSLLGNYVGGGVIGEIVNVADSSKTYLPCSITIKNSVTLLKNIDFTENNGRIYGKTRGEKITMNATGNYGWEGTMDSQGKVFTPSEKNGFNVSTDSVWKNQSFFEELGWDFDNTWKMNIGNEKFRLPVLHNTLSTLTLDASYILKEEPLPVRKSSGSVASFRGEKVGNNFVFENAVVMTKATLPGASSAKITNNGTGDGWYKCILETDGFKGNGVLYFQVPLDVLKVKGWTMNDVSLFGCKTTYLSTDGKYAKYSGVISQDGPYTIGFEKDAASKQVVTAPVEETTKPVEVTLTLSGATAMKVGDTTLFSAKNSDGSTAKFSWKSSDDSVATVDENGNVKAVKVGTATITVTNNLTGKTATKTITVGAKAEPTQTTQSPFPVLGILAGLGVAAVLVMRRKL